MRIFKHSDAGPMPKGGVPKRGPLNWTVVRDIDGHRGCTLKLCNPRGARAASLTDDGTILGR